MFVNLPVPPNFKSGPYLVVTFVDWPEKGYYETGDDNDDVFYF